MSTMILFAEESTAQVIGISIVGSVFLIGLFTFIYLMAKLDKG